MEERGISFLEGNRHSECSISSYDCFMMYLYLKYAYKVYVTLFKLYGKRKLLIKLKSLCRKLLNLCFLQISSSRPSKKFYLNVRNYFFLFHFVNSR